MTDAALTDIAERFKSETAHHRMTVLHDDGLYRHLRFRSPRNGFYWFDLITWPGVLTVNGDCGTYTFEGAGDMFGFFRGHRINPQYWAEKIRAGNRRSQAIAASYSQDRLRRLIAEDLAVDDLGDGAEADWPGVTEAAMTQICDDGSEWNTEYEEGAREALDAFEFGATYMATCSCGSTKGGFVSDEAAREWCREHGPRRHDHVAKDVTKFDGFTFADTCEWNLHDWDWTFLWYCHAIVWSIARYDEYCPAKAMPEMEQAGV